MTTQPVKQKSKRGFASMSVEKRKAIASKGGIRAHLLLRAHRFTPEEASRAGKIGGVVAGKVRREAKDAAARA